MSETGLHNAEFMNNRFPKEVLQKLRLSFLTSQTLLDRGGSSFVEGKDFNEPLDLQNEQFVFNFLLERFEGHLSQTKSDDYYSE